MGSIAGKCREEERRQEEVGLILDLLSRRFGDLPDEVVQRVREADSDGLVSLGMAFLSAKSLDDVFPSGASSGHGSNGESRKS